jgi:hypothetical protein
LRPKEYEYKIKGQIHAAYNISTCGIVPSNPAVSQVVCLEALECLDQGIDRKLPYLWLDKLL